MLRPLAWWKKFVGDPEDGGVLAGPLLAYSRRVAAHPRRVLAVEVAALLLMVSLGLYDFRTGGFVSLNVMTDFSAYMHSDGECDAKYRIMQVSFHFLACILFVTLRFSFVYSARAGMHRRQSFGA